VSSWHAYEGGEMNCAWWIPIVFWLFGLGLGAFLMWETKA
jgi:hypothetical protein